MALYPATRFVFDRKKTATNYKAALIQVEVLFGKKKKYISTGVKVLKNQWSSKVGVCNCFEMTTLNERINAIKEKIDIIINSILDSGEAFSLEKLDHYLTSANEQEKTFLEYCENRIEERKDIRESTKKNHRKLIGSLKEFGKIKYFSDLSKKNIILYDDFLKSRGIRQTTVHSYHKFLKTYINDAIGREIITLNPYAGLKFKRGEGEQGRWLTEEEFEMIRNVSLPTETLRKVRDMFVLQCLTGLSYADLVNFDFSKVSEYKGLHYLSADRVKTGIEFCAVLLPEAMEIINRYDGQIPKISNQQYNMRLKIVAERAGIEKDIASHWGRRTCGMLLLNKGVSIEIVSKVLGHTSIRTTESAYAKILDKSVIEEVNKKML